MKYVSKKDVRCVSCGEVIEAGEYIVIVDGRYYCECCTDDSLEEGRPL